MKATHCSSSVSKHSKESNPCQVQPNGPRAPERTKLLPNYKLSGILPIPSGSARLSLDYATIKVKQFCHSTFARICLYPLHSRAVASPAVWDDSARKCKDLGITSHRITSGCGSCHPDLRKCPCWSVAVLYGCPRP